MNRDHCESKANWKMPISDAESGMQLGADSFFATRYIFNRESAAEGAIV